MSQERVPPGGGDQPTRLTPRARSSSPEDAPTELDDSGPRTSERHRADRLSSIGPYRVEGELGRGGMGVVWRGHDPRLDRPVAIKTLSPALAIDETWLANFVREARLLASLNHPHLALVYDLPLHDGQPVLVMELLDGESLAARLARGPLSIDETLHLGEQVASALTVAHDRGIVHRDLKPANVQVLASGDAKVLDFGLARRTTDEHREDDGQLVLAGTPGYMSPEQARCELIDTRSDVFAFGVLLYECLSGQRCFRGATTQALLTAALHEEPNWSALPDELSARSRELLTACLRKAPDARPSSAQELGDALRRERMERAGGASDAAALAERRASGPPHRLPQEHDDFVGREQELAELSSLFGGSTRLASVLGPGGTGKTRLVTRFAWSHRDGFPGGAWFCDLSDARNLPGVLHAVATTLDVVLGQDDAVSRLGHAIAGRGRCLIVLDNFEQVAQHADATVGRWVERAADACFLVTSRVVLDLSGERLQVEPLAIDGAGQQLFELRARARKPGFVVDDENREDVREIVRLVGGLPLAIELAAARARLLSPRQVVERMKDRFKLLSAPPGSKERQATMRAAIDWSWDLLSPWERAALAQTSVFEGGFTLEAAEAVLDLAAFPDVPWTLDVVQALLDKSLLRTWTPERAGSRRAHEPRFGLYASVHEYAAERLLDGEAIGLAADAADAIALRHGEHYAALGAATSKTCKEAERARQLLPDLDNSVAACRRAIARRDAGMAAASFATALTVLRVTGPFDTARDLGETALAIDGLEGKDRAATALGLGAAYRLAGRGEQAPSLLESALAISRELEDREGEASALNELAAAARKLGQPARARACQEDSLAIFRELGDRHGEGVALGRAGILDWQDGKPESARTLLEESLAIHREEGDRGTEATVLGNLGTLHLGLGQVEKAGELFEAALAAHRELGNRRLEAHFLSSLGVLHHQLGRNEEARQHFEEALATYREVGERSEEGQMLANLGGIAEHEGRFDDARTLLEEGLAILDETGTSEPRAAFQRTLGELHSKTGRLDDAEAVLDASVSFFRVRGNKLELGRSLTARGRHAARTGSRASARADLTEAEALAAEVGAGPDSVLRQQLAELREMLLLPPD